MRLKFHLCFFIVFLGSVVYWAKLNSSFSLDELQTAWVISGSFWNTLERTFQTQGFSPLYFSLLWLWTRVFESSELSLRLPSLVFVAGSGVALYSCLVRWRSRQTAIIGLVVFLGQPDITEAALFARPYALGILGLSASALFLEIWRRSGKPGHLFLATGCLGVAYLSQPMFLLGALPLAMLFVANKPLIWMRRRQIIGGLIFLAIIFLAHLPQLWHMYLRRDLMSIATQPSPVDLLINLFPPYFLLVGGLAYGLGRSFGLGQSQSWFKYLGPAVGFGTLAPVLIWAAYSWLGESSVFVSRYWAWTAIWWACLGAIMAERLKPRGQVVAALTFLAAGIAFNTTRDFRQEDWRSAASYLRGSAQPNQSVLFYSGVVESAHVPWLEDPIQRGQFESPLLYYTVPGDKILLPLRLGSDEAKEYWSKKVIGKLNLNTEVVLYGLDNLSFQRGKRRESIQTEIVKELVGSGFAIKSEKMFGRVFVVILERSNGPLVS